MVKNRAGKTATGLAAAYGTAGAVAGALRYAHLRTGFETEPEISGLAIPGNVYASLLAPLSFLVVASLLFLYYQGRYSKKPIVPEFGFRRVDGTAHIFLIIAVLSGFFSASLRIVYSLKNFSAWGIASGILLYGAACTVMTVVRGMSARFFSASAKRPAVLIPVFWACMNLLNAYHEESGNPVLLQYIFPVAGSVAALLAVYASAGYAFGRNSLRSAFLACCGLLFFGAMNAVGEIALALSKTSLAGLFQTSAGLSGTVHNAFVYIFLLAFAAAALHLLGPDEKPARLSFLTGTQAEKNGGDGEYDDSWL